MRALAEASVPFRSASGTVVAHVVLIPLRDVESVSTAPMVEVGEDDARAKHFNRF